MYSYVVVRDDKKGREDRESLFYLVKKIFGVIFVFKTPLNIKFHIEIIASFWRGKKGIVAKFLLTLNIRYVRNVK